MHYYFHPESDCYFYTTHPLGMDSGSETCVEITEQEYDAAMAKKGQAEMSRDPVTIEATATRMAVDDLSQPAAEQAAAADLVPDDKLVKVYIKIRNAKSAFNQQYKDQLEKEFDGPMRTIGAELKRRLMERKNDGLKTEHGTVYLAEEMKVSCQDWGVFYQWIKDHDALDMLEQRVKAGEVKTYMEKHNGELPPGLSVFRELEARVRKPTKRGEAAVDDAS